MKSSAWASCPSTGPGPKKPGGLLAAVARLNGREPQMTPEAAAFTCHELVGDSSRAGRGLDYRITPIHRLLGDTIAWMRGEGMLAPR